MEISRGILFTNQDLPTLIKGRCRNWQTRVSLTQALRGGRSNRIIFGRANSAIRVSVGRIQCVSYHSKQKRSVVTKTNEGDRAMCGHFTLY